MNSKDREFQSRVIGIACLVMVLCVAALALLEPEPEGGINMDAESCAQQNTNC